MANNNATDAICLWIDNDPTRRGDAIDKAHEGLDYLRDYLTGQIAEAGEPLPDGTVSEHDGGPYGIRQQYSPRAIANADWEEIRGTLKPLPDWTVTDVRKVIQSAVGDWCSPATAATPAGKWITQVIRAYEDDRETILWSEDPEGTAEDYAPDALGDLESWEIWTELQLWRFDAEIAYGGLAFSYPEDWDRQTMAYKQSALESSHIEMRLKENIPSLAQRVLEEIQGTIMSQLLQADLKAWDE